MRLVIVLVGALAVAGCVQHGGAIEGQALEVLDGSNRAPASGAFVVVEWRGFEPSLGHGQHRCLHLTVARADARGRFALPSWTHLKLYPATEKTATIRVVKRGFAIERHGIADDLTVLLVKDTGQPAKRLAFLEEEWGTLCDLRRGPIDGDLLAYYRELHDQASQLELEDKAARDRRKILLVELGYEIARLSGTPVKDDTGATQAWPPAPVVSGPPPRPPSAPPQPGPPGYNPPRY